MSSAVVDTMDIIVNVREYEEQQYLSPNLQDWYRRTARQGRFSALYGRSSFGVTLELLNNSSADRKQTTAVRPWMERFNSWLSPAIEAEDPKIGKRACEVGRDNASQFIEQAATASLDEWTQTLAYTDFNEQPVSASLLILAASFEKRAELPAWRILIDRCRKRLQSIGVQAKLIDWNADSDQNACERDSFIKAARMVACLESHKAMAGYLDAAVEFEKRLDVRSALACVYRNVRYRLRDNQLKLLNDDLVTFRFGEANTDTMLAVLTATAPFKTTLPNRRALFKQIQVALKKRGLMERGLLDGLK